MKEPKLQWTGDGFLLGLAAQFALYTLNGRLGCSLSAAPGNHVPFVPIEDE